MSNSTSSGGVGFFGLLFVVFLVLKLTKVIDWSWLWVTSPIWFWLAVALVLFLCGVILLSIGKRKNRRK